ncbi:MAG TPA: lipopolysaccharide assembly protein LapB [Burkholderiaceae bacterium]|nr:lipopolysaccharide assembly protein LapB [Burkholderiaceae bacterium]
MDFDLQWLLLGLPVAFALGWIGSRVDLRQWRREQRAQPKAYFKGLSLLLAEQPDKAIDAFIEAVQNDPDAAELHFALGNLFRRRGEFERAIRVHQYLLQRGDLPGAERQRAQHALAQDFMKAGLFDRAEAAFRALDGTPYETEARLALLQLHERARDWHSAMAVARQLELAGAGSFAQRIAHHHCELALQAEAQGDAAAADAALRAAREAAPEAARPLVLVAQRQARGGDTAAALASYDDLRRRNPGAFVLAASDYVDLARRVGQPGAARAVLEQLAADQPALELLRALATLDERPAGALPLAAQMLRAQPTLSMALEVLDAKAASDPALSAVRDAVARAAQPLQRYRCAACGFEAKRYFWQCPGCQSWDSFPPRSIEEA